MHVTDVKLQLTKLPWGGNNENIQSPITYIQILDFSAPSPCVYIFEKYVHCNCAFFSIQLSNIASDNNRSDSSLPKGAKFDTSNNSAWVVGNYAAFRIFFTGEDNQVDVAVLVASQVDLELNPGVGDPSTDPLSEDVLMLGGAGQRESVDLGRLESHAVVTTVKNSLADKSNLKLGKLKNLSRFTNSFFPLYRTWPRPLLLTAIAKSLKWAQRVRPLYFVHELSSHSRKISKIKKYQQSQDLNQGQPGEKHKCNLCAVPPLYWLLLKNLALNMLS